MLYNIKDINVEDLLIYLRKSRQDDPNETVEEVLANVDQRRVDQATAAGDEAWQ